MTPTELETLARIKAKCLELLDIASKRTPVTNVTRYGHGGGRIFFEDGDGKRKLIADFYHEEDREYYIASCAGPAGWRATAVAINGGLAAISLIHGVECVFDDLPPQWWTEKKSAVEASLRSIITAWEGLV